MLGGYHARLALIGMRQKPVLVTLIALALALGVALSMTAFTIWHVMGRDPIPEKSSTLFAVQIDNGGPRSRAAGSDEPPTQLSWKDVSALLNMHRAYREAAMYLVGLKVSADASGKGQAVVGRATSASFFAMFDVPLRYGRGWSDAEERDRARVLVVSAGLNERLFGGEDSTGRSITVDGEAWRVIGVAGAWDPKPLFYDLTGGNAFDEGEDAYVPLGTAIGSERETVGYEYCDAGPRGDSFADLLHSECTWLQYWAELPSPADARRYREGLATYANGQQQAGRFAWPANVRLTDVRQWLVTRKVVSDDARLSVIVAFAFLGICIVCALSLMLARALERSGEFSLRRALGASRGTVFSQAATEAGLIGLASGVLGVGLTLAALAAMRALFPADLARVAQVDPSILLGTVVLAATSALLAGLYPAWMAMRTPPALKLKEGL